MLKYTNAEAVLELKKNEYITDDYKLNKIIDTMIYNGYLKKDKIRIGDIELISNIYIRRDALKNPSIESYTTSIQKEIDNISKSKSFKEYVTIFQDDVKKENSEKEKADNWLFNFLNPFSEKIAGSNKNKFIRLIELVAILTVIFSVIGTVYVNVMSDTETGIKIDYARSSNIKKENIKNFSKIGSYKLNKEKHNIFTYMDKNGMWVVDINSNNKKIVKKEKINNNLKTNSPIILLQLLKYIEISDDNFVIKSISYGENHIKINDKKYILEINNTQVQSINGLNLKGYYNVLFSEKGQKDLLKKYNIEPDNAIIRYVNYDENKKDFCIEFEANGNMYQLYTYYSEKVVIYEKKGVQ